MLSGLIMIPVHQDHQINIMGTEAVITVAASLIEEAAFIKMFKYCHIFG